LNGTITTADLTRFQYFHTYCRIWPATVVAVLVLPVWVACCFFATDPDSEWHAVLKSALVFILPCSFLLLWAGLMPYRLARKQFATQNHLREPVTYIFTTATIQGRGTGFAWRIEWNLLKQLRETKSLFLLYHGPNIAVIVPKRFFQSAAEIEAWRQLTLACLTSKKIDGPGIVGRWC
jgi:hypothetical protein